MTFVPTSPFILRYLCHAQTLSLGHKQSSLRPAFPSVRVARVARVQRSCCGKTRGAHLNVTMRDENTANDGEEGNPPSWQFAYILTTVASMLSGGRVLPIFSGLFLGIARTVDAPLSLTAFSSVVSSALIDILIFRVAPPSSVSGLPYAISLQEGVPPYAVFVIGCIITATFDFDGFFQTISPGTKKSQDLKGATGKEISDKPKSDRGDELSSWDVKMGRRSVDKKK